MGSVVVARRFGDGRRYDDVALGIARTLDVGPTDEAIGTGAARPMADGATDGVLATGARGIARIGATALQAGLIGGAGQVAGALVVWSGLRARVECIQRGRGGLWARSADVTDTSIRECIRERGL